MSSRSLRLAMRPFGRIEVWSVAFAAGLGGLVLLGAWLSSWTPHDSAGSGPVRVGSPRVAIAPGRIDAAVDIKSSTSETISGWFFVSQAGSKELPWNDSVYKSAVRQFKVHRGKQVTFQWSESVALPSSLYQITFWFHKEVGGASVHVAGGSFGLPKLWIAGNAPFQQLFGQAVAQIVQQTTSIDQSRLALFGQAVAQVVQQATSIDQSRFTLFGQAVAQVAQLSVSFDQSRFTFTITLHVPADMQQGTISWVLRSAGDATSAPLYFGRQQAMQFVPGMNGVVLERISEDVAIAKGNYDLWIYIDSAERPDEPQRVVYRNALVQETDPAFTRQVAADGPFQISLSSPPNALYAGQDNVLDLDVSGAADGGASCVLGWRLLTDGDQPILAANSGTDCAHPSIHLPSDIAPGRYRLELSAYAEDGLQEPWSDTIVVVIDVLN